MGGSKNTDSLHSALFVDWYLSWPMYPFEGDQQGADVVEWYRQLFQNATTFASILASILFSAMVLDLRTVTPLHGSTGQVRTWSAIGAILFVLLVLLCQGFSLILQFHRTELGNFYDNKNLGIRLVFAFVSLGFQALLLTGTLFFCLVVKAYVPGVGWTALGIVSALLVLSLLLWARQLVWEFWSQARSKNPNWKVDVAPAKAEYEKAATQASKADRENDESAAGKRTVKKAQATLHRAEINLDRVRAARDEYEKIRADKKKESRLIAERIAKDSVQESKKDPDPQQAEIHQLAAGVTAMREEANQTLAAHQSCSPADQTRVSAQSGEEEGPSPSSTDSQRPPYTSRRGDKNAMGEGDIV